MKEVVLTPSWGGLLYGLLSLAEGGQTAESRVFARRELERMAALADGLADMTQAVADGLPVAVAYDLVVDRLHRRADRLGEDAAPAASTVWPTDGEDGE